MTPASRLSAALFAVALVLSPIASGQTAAPVTPTVTPAPNCEKPGDPPTLDATNLGKAAAAQRQTKWTTGMRAYLECIKAFVAEQQSAAAPHIRASNAGIEEFNKAMKAYNDYVELLQQ
jgi:hypothetical protein